MVNCAHLLGQVWWVYTIHSYCRMVARVYEVHPYVTPVFSAWVALQLMVSAVEVEGSENCPARNALLRIQEQLVDSDLILPFTVKLLMPNGQTGTLIGKVRPHTRMACAQRLPTRRHL